MHVEAALAVEATAPGTERQQIEHGLDVGIEAVVALAGEREVATGEQLDRLARVAIEVRGIVDAGSGEPPPLVLAVVERRDQSLVVRRHDAGAEQLARATRPVDASHGVRLHQVLSRPADVLDDSIERLQDRLPVAELRGEVELVAERGTPGGDVLAECDVDLVAHVVVEAVLVRPDPRLLERIDGERGRQVLDAVLLGDEGVDVGRVGGVVERDERGVHVTGRQQR